MLGRVVACNTFEVACGVRQRQTWKRGVVRLGRGAYACRRCAGCVQRGGVLTVLSKLYSAPNSGVTAISGWSAATNLLFYGGYVQVCPSFTSRASHRFRNGCMPG